MKSHAIVAAAPRGCFGVRSTGRDVIRFSAASPHDAVAQATHRSPGALPHAGFVLAKIDQNNTPPDRGGDPSGRSHSGMRM